MTNEPDPIAAAVDSIFEFIQRTAEPAEVGRCWVTIDYENKPQRDPSVFNGVGGISFFLVDAFRRSGRTEALALAWDALDWCVAFRGKYHQRGLHVGKTGVALAALHMSIALGEAVVPDYCLENARVILREPPGPVTDLLGGEASNGLYQETTPDGDAWPTDVPGLYSADFEYGASGVGHFLLRVLDDGATRLPLL